MFSWPMTIAKAVMQSIFLSEGEVSVHYKDEKETPGKLYI